MDGATGGAAGGTVAAGVVAATLGVDGSEALAGVD